MEDQIRTPVRKEESLKGGLVPFSCTLVRVLHTYLSSTTLLVSNTSISPLSYAAVTILLLIVLSISTSVTCADCYIRLTSSHITCTCPNCRLKVPTDCPAANTAIGPNLSKATIGPFPGSSRLINVPL